MKEYLKLIVLPVVLIGFLLSITVLAYSITKKDDAGMKNSTDPEVIRMVGFCKKEHMTPYIFGHYQGKIAIGCD